MYKFLDHNEDGVIDTWILDVDADGVMDDVWHYTIEPSVEDDPTSSRLVNTPGSIGEALASIGGKEIGWNWPEINAVMAPVLQEVPKKLFALNQRLTEALISFGDTKATHPFTLARDWDLAFPSVDEAFMRKLLTSDETLRFYLDLLKDRLIIKLKKRFQEKEFWTTFTKSRSTGDLDGMRMRLEEQFKLTHPIDDFDGWKADIQKGPVPPKTAWAQDWVPPNIGWESEKIAYRVYWGQFDFFGKKGDRLLYPTIGSMSYHDETEWGIDALLVGDSPGCGGVTLYINGKAYPVRNPAGKGNLIFEKRLLSQEDEQVTIELTAKGVGPEPDPYTVRFVCAALTGRADTPISIQVDGGDPEDDLALGIGFTKLPAGRIDAGHKRRRFVCMGIADAGDWNDRYGRSISIGTFSPYGDLTG